MVATSPNFRVYSDGDERSLRERVQMLEDFDMTLRFMHGLPADKAADRRLDVHLLANLRALRVTFPGAGDTLAGYYTATSRDIVCCAIRGRAGNKETDDITLHEYVHHFMKRNFNYAYAPWLIEGYAEYFATTEFQPNRILIGKLNSNRAAWLMNESWIPMRDLLTKRSGEIRGAAQFNYYPQSWLLAHYFLGNDARKAQLMAYMRGVGEGKGSVEAMEAATGAPIGALESALRAYTRTNLPVVVLNRKRSTEVEIKVERLSPSADDLLLPRLRMAHDDLDKGGEAFVADMRKTASRYPGDRFAELTLACAEQLAGDKAAAAALLDSRLKADPQDVEALEMRALALLDAADDETDNAKARALLNQAAGLIGRAFKIDPNRYQLLLAYARSRRASPSYPTENDMEVLLLANDLAPQVSEVALATVGVLAARQHYAQAANILKPLANDPHGGGASESAVRYLKELEAKASAANAPKSGKAAS